MIPLRFVDLGNTCLHSNDHTEVTLDQFLTDSQLASSIRSDHPPSSGLEAVEVVQYAGCDCLLAESGWFEFE